jgi:hypothetical protein
MLCALDLEEPCSTFRADRPEGLVPPRQPRLLLRPPRWAAGQRAGQMAGAGAAGQRAGQMAGAGASRQG